MIRKLIYLLALAAALSLGSCVNECEDCNFDLVRPRHSRILFHYLAMDNNLSKYGKHNLADMLKGATKENMNDGAIVVFSDMPGANSRLLYIRPGKDGQGQQVVLHEWKGNLDSSDPEIFRAAFEKARELLNAEQWALVIGSHGSGWIPFEVQSSYMQARSSFEASLTRQEEYGDPQCDAETRALLSDRGNYMDIDRFIEAIPDNTFDFIIMDLCFMGGVEFAYAIRNKTEQLVVSPAEVISYGMPYDRIMKHIFADTPVLGENGVCGEFYDFYLNVYANSDISHDIPGNKFATIALYDCSALDMLAEAVGAIVSPREAEILALSRAEIEAGIQYFDRPYKRHTMFDLKEFIYKIHTGDDELRRVFDDALSEVVVYKKSTGKPYSGFSVHEDRCCGVSTYIPIGEYADLNAYYWLTEWGKAVYRK